jgi:lipopolysaccharide/colanic/teichoic acid biosynthesis glycosyltransferase
MSESPLGSDPVTFWSEGSDPATLRKWTRHARRKARLWKTAILALQAVKRLVDILGSSAALLVLSPVYGITALLIKLEDGGPVFFGQTRVGAGGRLFKMWKFRSMVPDADAKKDQLLADNQHGQSGVTFKMKDDPRITRMGKWIRKFSVDELPQFYNVLRGDMSLVGPRPPVPREVRLYLAGHLRRLTVKPGITCLWQIGGRAEIDFEGQVRLDLQYIRSGNPLTDLLILVKTIPAVLLGKGAY